jgi:bifunctional DNA-binding transcriptional regulator/antitoxin component of YhaV-PrlF toxin-antitoxin module
MTVQLKKVDGGYELFIPDEVAVRNGLDRGGVVLLDAGDEVIVRCPEHRAAVLRGMIERITPDTLPDPREPYDPPAGYARVG